VPGLPFDPATGTVPHDATETVRALLDDAVAGRLPDRDGSPRAFARSVRRRRTR
jgi:hypothetical protein